MESQPRFCKIDNQRCTPERDPTRGGEAVTFKEVLAQVIDWLQQDKRLSYRACSANSISTTTTLTI